MVMKKILLLGHHSPTIDKTEVFQGFPQLRTWSMRRFLEQTHDVHCVYLTDTNPPHPQESLYNIHNPTDQQRLYNLSGNYHCIITAGPFLPLIATQYLREDIPLWLDYPSDALADMEIKSQSEDIPHTEKAFVHQILRYAITRADAIGVISHRQKSSTMGQLLLLGSAHTPIFYTPIAYEFPTPEKKHKKQTTNILLAGSNNAWLDTLAIQNSVQNYPGILHCTGGNVPFYKSQNVMQYASEKIHRHGWLDDHRLAQIVDDCGYGIWVDKPCVESFLGSRTRALFYIWNGLLPIGTPNTELGQTLLDNNALIPFQPSTPLQEYIQRNSVHIHHTQTFCTENFAPEKAYRPLVEWLEKPTLLVHTTNGIEDCIQENKRLQEQLQQIQQTPTWKLLHKLHSIKHNIMGKQ